MEATTAAKPASCADTSGNLPSCAPLATPYVPFQQANPQVYPATLAFIRGTLYPGLDLPFFNLFVSDLPRFFPICFYF